MSLEDKAVRTLEQLADALNRRDPLGRLRAARSLLQKGLEDAGVRVLDQVVGRLAGREVDTRPRLFDLARQLPGLRRRSDPPAAEAAHAPSPPAASASAPAEAAHAPSPPAALAPAPAEAAHAPAPPAASAPAPAPERPADGPPEASPEGGKRPRRRRRRRRAEGAEAPAEAAPSAGSAEGPGAPAAAPPKPEPAVPEPTPAAPTVDLHGERPAEGGFAIDRLVLVPRGPDLAFAYWELAPARLAAIADPPPVEAELRVVDEGSGEVVHRTTVDPRTGRTYVPLPQAGRAYVGELLAPSGQVLSRSRPIVATDEAARARIDELVRPF